MLIMLKETLKNRSLFFLMLVLLSACGSQTEKLEQEARERMKNGKFAEAVSLLDEIIKTTQASAEIYNMRGAAHYNLNKNAEALTDFDQAIRQDSSNYRFYYNRGNVKRTLNRPESAIKDYTSALQLESNQYEIYLNRALSYQAVRNNAAALQDFNQAELLSNGKDAKIYFYRGKLRMVLEDFEGALSDFKASLAIEPQNGEAYLGLALARINIEGEANEESCQDIERSVQLGFLGAEQFKEEYCK
mgnify:CR=1 FL=1